MTISDWAPPSREELELDQIRADIALKRAQTQWEPWKAMATAFGAGAAIFSAFGILIGYLLRSTVH
jgi:hypothetical protein